MVELEFFGAAETVTGSMHVLHLPEGVFMLDCGLFQGKRDWARKLNQTSPVTPKDLTGVLLSHAHLDHCGKIPYLYTNGFKGPIYATNATCDLAEVMLADSAHIQEEDAKYWNAKRARTEEERIEPLYTIKDLKLIEGHYKGCNYGREMGFSPGCTVKFLEAGHILGAGCVLVEMTHSRTVRLLFTGDIGRFNVPILKDPTCPLPQVDYLITESTYANGRHDPAETMEAKLVEVVKETAARGGKVIIPAFSLGRTQHIVYCLARAIEAGEMEKLPIYVDSPLSNRVTEIFKAHPECFDETAVRLSKQKGGLFGNNLITDITDVEDSKALHDKSGPMIIISASGMCEAGRILHHLKNNVEDERNTIVAVGYMAANTLGRRIVEKQETLRILGRDYHLKAQVAVLNGFSSHADADDFAKLLGPLAKGLKGAFVVHGEEDQTTAMKGILESAGCTNVHAPAPGEKFELS